MPANEARARVAQRRPHLAAEVTQADLDLLAALAEALATISAPTGALAVALLAELEPHQLATASPASEWSVTGDRAVRGSVTTCGECRGRMCVCGFVWAFAAGRAGNRQ